MMKKFVLPFAAAFLGGLLSLSIYTYLKPLQSHTTDNASLPAAPPVHYANYSMLSSDSAVDFTDAAARSVNSVVHVKTQVSVKPAYNPWMDFFGYRQEPEIQMASGSGVIISADGYIVTNNHVVDGADKLVVTLNNNKNYDAYVVGTDPATDIAVIKVKANDLPVLNWGNSDNVKVGQWVLAVGNPFDLTSTVTAGIVSAKARNINLLNPGYNMEIFPVESFIQTDAAVNPGNSGGALVNTQGELIGINTAIASRTGSYSGYSFAVPAAIAQKVAADLIKYGSVQRAFIGVRIAEVTQKQAEEAGLREVAGVYVNDLTAGGAAAEAGIQAGDIILKVSDVPVRNVPELQEQVSKYHPGDRINVSVWRKGKPINIVVTLRDQQGNSDMNKTSITDNTENDLELGAQFSNPSPQELNQLGLKGGAKVSALNNGKFKEIGIQKGFIITKLGGEQVNNAEELKSKLKQKKGDLMIEGYYPNGTKAYYGFTWK